MAPIVNHVLLSISVDSVGVARAGFGVPLVVTHNAPGGFTERTREYSSVAEVATDFPATTGPEYLAAQAIFGQSPHPAKMKIGRAALQAKTIYSISVVTVRNSHVYKLRIKGEGVTPTEVSFTSVASASDGGIITGLRDAINAVVGKNFTAVGTTSPLIVTGTAAGDWFSVEVLDETDLSVLETTADPGIATDLTAIALEDNDWYGLYTWFNSNAYGIAAAAWAEANKKIYACDSNDSVSITAAAGGGDLLDDLFAATYARSFGNYHQAPDQMFGAAWLGDCLPRDPGSQTWKFKRLAGVSVRSLTSTQRANLRGKNGNAYETVAGVNFTFEGQMADGQFIDTQRFLDWLDDDMSKSVLEIKVGADKIPYTDAGVAMIESAMRASLRRGVGLGGLKSDPEPTVTVPKVADVSTANKTARTLPDMKASAELAGAVHKTIVTVVVSV